jgi:hypothetical protein
VAELRRRHTNDLRGVIATSLREQADRMRRDNLAYERLAGMLRRRAGELEHGAKAVVVHGWEIPHESRPDGLNPSNSLLLHLDGRLEAFRADS